MVLVGDWPAVPAGRPTVRVGETLIIRCEARVRAFQLVLVMTECDPVWLILGEGPDEVRERMSGNLCRCGAYVNIVAAILEAGR